MLCTLPKTRTWCFVLHIWVSTQVSGFQKLDYLFWSTGSSQSVGTKPGPPSGPPVFSSRKI